MRTGFRACRLPLNQPGGRSYLRAGGIEDGVVEQVAVLGQRIGGIEHTANPALDQTVDTCGKGGRVGGRPTSAREGRNIIRMGGGRGRVGGRSEGTIFLVSPTCPLYW